MRKHSINCRTISFICLFLLTSCSSWNEEFEDKVVRAYPKASIHKISKMVDKGIIKETDDDSFVSGTLVVSTLVFELFVVFVEVFFMRMLQKICTRRIIFILLQNLQNGM